MLIKSGGRKMICPHCKKEIGTRERILEILNKPKIISELAKELELTRPTIYEHLKILKLQKKIKLQKDEVSKGKPVWVTII